jgi:ribonuclease P protein component
MTGVFTFGKKERLSQRAAIERLFNEGKSFSVPPFRVFYITAPKAAAPVQILIAVPKRKYKRAVDRNKLKRLIREAYRLNKAVLTESVKGHSLMQDLLFGEARASFADISKMKITWISWR